MVEEKKKHQMEDECPLTEEEWLEAVKIMDEYNSRPRLDNFLWRIDHEVESHKEYYELIAEIILVCRVFDDEEIRELSNLVRAKWVGKRGKKVNEDDEHFVFDKFIAKPGMNDEQGPPRVEAIKIIMKKLGKTEPAAGKLYDKVMHSLRQPHSKRGRKKGNIKI